MYVKNKIQYDFEQPQSGLHFISRFQELYYFIQTQNPTEFKQPKHLNPLALFALFTTLNGIPIARGKH